MSTPHASPPYSPDWGAAASPPAWVGPPPAPELHGERLARSEISIQYLSEAQRTTTALIHAHDERLRKKSSRLGQLADAGAGHARDIATLQVQAQALATQVVAQTARLDAAEARTKWRADLVRYAMAVAFLALSLLGKGDVKDTVRMVWHVFGLS